MFVVRLIGLASAAALAVLVVLWLVTGERRWLQRAWLLFKVALFVVLLFLLLLLGEALLHR